MIRAKFFFVLFILVSFLISGYATAEVQKEKSGEVFELGEIVVTANSDTISKVATTETIDRDHIQLNDLNNIADALDTMPGLSISKGSRNEAYINVRGFNQRYVPIFFDGIPWYIPYEGYVDPGEISTGNISRITLSKGAASTLYGANTMGGVINIISMRPTETFEGSLKFDYGLDRYRGTINLGSMMGKFYIMGGFTGLNNDYFEMSEDYIPPDEDSPEKGDERDNSDVRSHTESIKIGFMPAEGHEYALGYYNTSSEKGLPPNVYSTERPRFWRFPEWEKTTYYFIGDSRITDNLSAKVRIYHDEYYNVLDAFDDANYTTQNARSSFHSTYDDHTDGGSLILRTDYFNKNILSFSYHIKDDVHKAQGDPDDPWEKYKTRTSSYGVEDSIELTEKAYLVAGINYDVQDAKYANGGETRDNDDSLNGILGLSYGLTDKTELHVSAAKKTRFPTQKELFSSYLDSAAPNPNLRKEESLNYEAGIASAIPFENIIDFSLFYSDVTDLITETTITVGEEELDYNDNIGEASYKGFEFSLTNTYFDKNNIQLAYAYVDAQNDTPGRESDYLPETPKHQFKITDLITFNDYLSLLLKARYDKGQKEEKRNGDWVELDDYWVFDIKGMFQMTKNFQVNMSLQNLLDENYSTGYGFPREGRSLFIGLEANF